jgi:AcrR family transcriptional regulator
MPKVTDAHLAARRRQIMDAAAAAFAERGFAGTSMADIVRASGLSVGAVYRYFSSKEELVLAVVAGRDGRQESGGFPEESAGELLRRLIGYVAAPDGAVHARLVSVIWGDATVSPRLAAVARERHADLERHLAALLASGSPQGADEDVTAAAQVALAALIGYSALVSTDIPVDTERFLRVLERLFPSPGSG